MRRIKDHDRIRISYAQDMNGQQWSMIKMLY